MDRPGQLDEDEHEILHLKKRMEMDGDIYERQVSYLSDHQIFHNFSVNGAWQGWEYWKLWGKLEEIYQVAQQKAEKGWSITWHPAYSPGAAEFRKSVSFLS